MKKFNVQIVETYSKYVVVEAEDYSESYETVEGKISCAEINLPSRDDDYEYDMELFINNTV